ncbi:MAG: HAD family phosphatase [Erysipelotrichaceae bacterium]|nr:HAD family phosphatase [Erysipelotrichaceae bacterium]
MSNEVKAVIFDFNGTLFFDNDKHVKAWGKISQLIRGHGISEEELHAHFNGVPNAKIIQYMLNQEGTEEQVEKYSCLKEEIYRILCKEDEPTFHLVKGAEEYFNHLKEQGIPFTIASASIKENIDFFVESFQLDRWIDPDSIVYDDGTYANKIAMFKDAAKRLNAEVKDCLIIEDSISGIKNGYHAGCRNIIVVDSANKKEEYELLPGVTQVINDFTECLK